jgi:hypothetical protein
MVWILLASLTAAAQAPASANTSVYTPLETARCRLLGRIEEGESASWRCPGHAGIPLFIHTGDGRFDVDAGLDNNVWESLSAFNALGPRLEWRLRAGRPIAIIYRYHVATPDGAPYSRIAVETIGRAGRPGCVIAWIDGRSPTANGHARAVADRRAERFRCGVDRAEGQPD